MNQKIKLSVIIPVYNVENFIAKCLDSILNQSDETIEIICVNDGSTDGSRKIIGDYQNLFPFIKCIDRPNGGLSAARNTGLFHANGEYILFLDSDDWLEENVLGTIYQKSKESNLDVLIGNTKWIYTNKIQVEKLNSVDVISNIISGKDAIVKLMKAEIYVPMAYNYICKRDFILSNKLFFKEGLIYEDELWTPQLLIKARRVLAFQIYHYNYLQRENTIMNSSVNYNKVDSLFYISKKLIKFAKSKYNQELKDCLWLRSCLIYNIAIKSLINIDISYNKPFEITWNDLRKAKLSYTYFNKCIGFLPYKKSRRRIFRLVYKLIS
jgi:glycosyltransferase involved in cell wall biosynthesis